MSEQTSPRKRGTGKREGKAVPIVVVRTCQAVWFNEANDREEYCGKAVEPPRRRWCSDACSARMAEDRSIKREGAQQKRDESAVRVAEDDKRQLKFGW